MYNPYAEYEKNCSASHKRKCIDGKLVNFSLCVAFCEYEEHPGFLTEALCRQHNCIGYHCTHYVPKLNLKEKIKKDKNTFGDALLQRARELTKDFDGFKVMCVESEFLDSWIINYITITNAHTFEDIEKKLKEETDCEITFHNLHYNFDVCVKLLGL